MRGGVRRRDAGRIPEAEESRQEALGGGSELHAPSESGRHGEAAASFLSSTVNRLNRRERGPWGGGKFWLDMTATPKLTNNLSVRNRLLLARWSWGSSRLLRRPPMEDFFPSSYRYRGHEGCVNAIKFHPTEPWLFSGGDDLRLLIWEPRVWPRTPRTAIRTEHSDNIFCIDFDSLGRQALTSANDGLVTRIPLTLALDAEIRTFNSLFYAHPRVERMRNLSLPLTHPDTTPGAFFGSAAASAARSSLEAINAAEDELLFSRRRSIKACFEAKFIDTAGQVAAVALEMGFISLADFRERPEVTHAVLREDGDMTSVDPHLPNPYQLAYAGSCGAGILDVRTARPVMRLRAPGVITGESEFEAESRSRNRSHTRRKTRTRTSSASSGNSSNEDDANRGPASIQENLELILRLRARVGSLLSRMRSHSNSPEAPRVSRRVRQEPGTTAALTCRTSSQSSRSSTSSSSSSSSSSRSSSGGSSSGDSRCSLPRDEVGASERPQLSHPGRGKRLCLRSDVRQLPDVGVITERSSSSSSRGGFAGLDAAGSADLLLNVGASRTPQTQHTPCASGAASCARPGQQQQQQQPARRRPRRRGRQQRAAQSSETDEERQRRPRSGVSEETAALRCSPRRQPLPGDSASSFTEAAAAEPFDHSRQPLEEEVPHASHAARCSRALRVRRRAAQRRPSSATASASSERTASQRGDLLPQRTVDAGSQAARHECRRSRRRRRRAGGSRWGRHAAVLQERREDEAELAGPATQSQRGQGPLRRRGSWAREGNEEHTSVREEPQESESIRAALRQAEAIAAELPPIRFPTYANVTRSVGSKPLQVAATVDELPLIQMVDKIVYSWDGRLLLVIRRGKIPLIYSTDWELPLFELRSEGYINVKTMKGGCFFTDGRHVACGSENLKVHLWRLPSPLPHHPSATQSLNRIALLHGHLCVINCCASPAPDSPLGLWGPPMLATSGVEKMVRVWSYETHKDKDDCDDYPFDGRFITHDSTEDFLTIARFNRVTPHSESQEDETSDIHELLDEMYDHEDFYDRGEDGEGSFDDLDYHPRARSDSE
ncbi:hypothetical protein Efla_005430 [Eimeria flavescens]